MKGRVIKPYSSKTLLNCWRKTLGHLNAMKADKACDLDPHALAEVTDYILDNIDHYRPHVAARSTEKVSLKTNTLRLSDNREDNESGGVLENGR